MKKEFDVIGHLTGSPDVWMDQLYAFSLQAFGAFCWLVVEPSDALFENLVISSQMRAAYQASSVDCTAGGLKRSLGTTVDVREYVDPVNYAGYRDRSSNSSNNFNEYQQLDTLQPMVVSSYDIARLMEELRSERVQKEYDYRKKKENLSTTSNILNTGWMKKWYRIFLRRKSSGAVGSCMFC